MTAARVQDDFIGTWRRRSLLLLAGAAVAPALAEVRARVPQPPLLQLARELGLTGMGARALVRKVGTVLGPQPMERHRLALLHRMSGCGCAMEEVADLLRMWAREDFAQNRTTVVGGLRFADTELAVFALVDHG
jgi:hypothetical protein